VLSLTLSCQLHCPHLTLLELSFGCRPRISAVCSQVLTSSDLYWALSNNQLQMELCPTPTFWNSVQQTALLELCPVTNFNRSYVKVKVKVMLQLKISQSVCLGVQLLLVLMTRCLLLFESYCHVFVGCPLRREGGVCRLPVRVCCIRRLSVCTYVFTFHMFNIYSNVYIIYTRPLSDRAQYS
jgi:hypothetical protein